MFQFEFKGLNKIIVGSNFVKSLVEKWFFFQCRERDTTNDSMRRFLIVSTIFRHLHFNVSMKNNKYPLYLKEKCIKLRILVPEFKY